MGRGEGGRSLQVCRVQILKEEEPFVSVAAADKKKRKKKKVDVLWVSSQLADDSSIMFCRWFLFLQFNMSKENWRQTRQNGIDSLGFSSERILRIFGPGFQCFGEKRKKEWQSP